MGKHFQNSRSSRSFPILEAKQSDPGFTEWLCHEQMVVISYLLLPFGDERIHRGHPTPVHHCILGLRRRGELPSPRVLKSQVPEDIPVNWASLEGLGFGLNSVTASDLSVISPEEEGSVLYIEEGQ